MQFLDLKGDMMKVFNRFLSIFAVAVVLQFSAAVAKADIPVSTFIGMVNVGASLDTTYQYVFNCDNETVAGCPGERGLYPEHNDFSIDSFTLSLEKEADATGASPMDKVGFRADILFGEQAERLGFGFNSDGDGAVSPYQAYISIAPSENFSIIAGQFTTLAGWELIEAKNNTNISRSLLFYRIPFAHSGARASYSASGVDLTFGISNDWDAVDDNDDGKTFEFQTAYSHGSETGFINDLWLGATLYVGKSDFLESKAFARDDDGSLADFTAYEMSDASTSMVSANPSDNKTRTLLTLVGSMTSGKLTFVGDVEFTWVGDGLAEPVLETITGDDPRTADTTETTFIGPTGVAYNDFFRWGVGGYLIYEANKGTTLSLRAEYVDDSDTDGNGVKLFELTPTVGWKPFGDGGDKGTLETRFEYRWDRADVHYFPSDSGDKKDQHGLLFQLLYSI
ncbi:MAG: outer membrane beta-barrel protein [Candidatus Mycalebacterium zealandia]|nr:MAG: outer membrane beta-barrel protein [Candidatus Mycalebacterium zealandia]